MRKIISIGSVFLALGLVWEARAAEVVLGSDLKIPPHYKPGGGSCSPGRGYSFSAEAPNHPSTYPKLNLRVFNGEVIGLTFELDAKEGWKPWYDQAEGNPTVHDGSMKHYTQRIYFKKGPRLRSVRPLRDLTVTSNIKTIIEGGFTICISSVGFSCFCRS